MILILILIEHIQICTPHLQCKSPHTLFLFQSMGDHILFEGGNMGRDPLEFNLTEQKGYLNSRQVNPRCLSHPNEFGVDPEW